MEQNIMRATLGRLPMYLDYLTSLDLREYPTISATVIAKNLGLGEVQVRKDLSAVSGNGKPKTGYVTDMLISDIERTLGRGATRKAVIVGAGKLGRALLTFRGFSSYGVEMIAGFDSNPSKLGMSENGKTVYPTDRFDDFCKDNAVEIGVITVPSESAQKTADMMVNAGIKAIWNFALVNIVVPEDVVVHNENLALSLCYLRTRMK